jgi:hypothetical protein
MEINQKMTEIEKGFNIAGGIPFVSILSGSLRMIAGKIQLIAGALIGFVGLVGQMINSNQILKWEGISEKGLEHLIHGGLNIGRGLLEAFLGATLLGSLGILAGQSLSSNKFEPIHKYE